MRNNVQFKNLFAQHPRVCDVWRSKYEREGFRVKARTVYVLLYDVYFFILPDRVALSKYRKFIHVGGTQEGNQRGELRPANSSYFLCFICPSKLPKFISGNATSQNRGSAFFGIGPVTSLILELPGLTGSCLNICMCMSPPSKPRVT